ncbi:MAG: NifB/NifX family molybdenum-iron cluster-binding protein [Bacillota bacterium]
MIIGVATENGRVAEHFGRCPEYTLFKINGNQIKEQWVITNPGHKPGFLPGYLADIGVNLVMSGGMGQKAMALFAEKNIETCTGVSGLVENVVNSYLSGSLEPGMSKCDHQYGGHSCD